MEQITDTRSPSDMSVEFLTVYRAPKPRRDSERREPISRKALASCLLHSYLGRHKERRSVLGAQIDSWVFELLSPRKGFSCAYLHHMGCASCSRLGYRAIRRRGIGLGLGLLCARFGRCRAVHMSPPEGVADQELSSSHRASTERSIDSAASATRSPVFRATAGALLHRSTCRQLVRPATPQAAAVACLVLAMSLFTGPGTRNGLALAPARGEPCGRSEQAADLTTWARSDAALAS